MKYFILLIGVMFCIQSYGHVSYYGLFSNSLEDISRRQQEMQRKQECMMQNQREQSQYADCLANCRMLNSSFCACVRPFTSYCY